MVALEKVFNDIKNEVVFYYGEIIAIKTVGVREMFRGLNKVTNLIVDSDDEKKEYIKALTRKGIIVCPMFKHFTE